MNTNFSRLQQSVEDKFAHYECEQIEIRNRMAYLENKRKKSRSKSNRPEVQQFEEESEPCTQVRKELPKNNLAKIRKDSNNAAAS